MNELKQIKHIVAKLDGTITFEYDKNFNAQLIMKLGNKSLTLPLIVKNCQVVGLTDNASAKAFAFIDYTMNKMAKAII